MVSVADFGALGNGASDDRPSIQAAMDHASSTGARVYFPAGRFRLATASLPGDRILVTQPNQKLIGAGAERSRLVVGASLGGYVAVIGAARDSLGTGVWSMTDLAVDQNARAGNGLDVTGMYQSPKMALRLGDYGPDSQVVVARSAFYDSDSLNTLYLFGSKISVTDSDFSRIGGVVGRPEHDHSTIYTTATSADSVQQISTNTFVGVRSSGGSRTAIETHGGAQRITDNVINDYLRGFNVTGVAGFPTAKAVVSGNTVKRAAIGVQLWSQSTAALPSSGLANVQLLDNLLELDAMAWRTAVLNTPTAGVLINPSNTSPVNGLTIAKNRIGYAPVTVPAAVQPYSAGVSCLVTASAGRPKKVVITGNVITRAPTAIDSTCLVDGALVTDNETS